jgi:hypothetical protein
MIQETTWLTYSWQVYIADKALSTGWGFSSCASL